MHGLGEDGYTMTMAHDPEQQTRDLIKQLREQGHHAEADRLERHVAAHPFERGLLFTLRETLETILTAIEAIDPVTQTMIEELRLEVEKRLRLSGDYDDTAH
jgi:hypothetical protein